MPWYPGADRTVAGIDGGVYVGGPWRIVWHTTELGTAEAGIRAWRRRNFWPHFQIDESTIYQFLDTDVPARSLVNRRGGVQTNRWHAVQIELVGWARQAKPTRQLILAAKVARWIETTHGVPQLWPAGHPPANAVATPRMQNAATWRRQAGHYGHCHVPENNHGDPGYLNMDILMASEMKLLALTAAVSIAEAVPDSGAR